MHPVKCWSPSLGRTPVTKDAKSCRRFTVTAYQRLSCDQFDTLLSHERHAGMEPGNVVEDVARIRRCFGTLARFYFFALDALQNHDKLKKLRSTCIFTFI